MLLGNLVFARFITYNDSDCKKIVSGFNILEPGEEGCIALSFYIASNNTNYSITATYTTHDGEFLDSVTRNKPFAVSLNISSYARVNSKIKCLENSYGCKLQLFRIDPSVISFRKQISKRNGIEYTYDYKHYQHFSAKSSGSLTINAKQEVVYKNKQIYFYIESFNYANIDKSFKKITNSSTNPNISVIVSRSASELSNTTSFEAYTVFNDQIVLEHYPDEFWDQFNNGTTYSRTI